jgi:CHAT domain-containing protein/tetratricopeptide (TPR) repeat protein
LSNGENLNQLYERLSNLDVQKQYDEALDISTRICSIIDQRQENCDIDLIPTLMNLVNICYYKGDYPNSKKLEDTCIIINPRLKEDQARVLELYTTANKYKVGGNYYEAERLFLESVEIGVRALGETHVNYLYLLDNIGTFYHSMGQYGRAREYLKKTLEIRQKILGQNHPDVAVSLNNLSNLCIEMGKLDEAQAYSAQALNILNETIGKHIPKYVAALSNLAMVHYSHGDYGNAAELTEKALKIQQSTLGDKHPECATTLSNLAQIYLEERNLPETNLAFQKILDKAERYFLDAYEIRKTSLSESHPDYARSLNSLAYLYRVKRDYDKAEEYYSQALETIGEALGKSHPDYALVLYNLGRICQLNGNYSKAQSLFQQALDIQEQTLGDGCRVHPIYAQSLNGLSAIFVALGSHSKAVPLMKESEKINDNIMSQIFGFVSEIQRLAFLETIKLQFHAFLSYTLQYSINSSNDDMIYDAMNLVLKRKSMGAEVLSIRRDVILSEMYPDLVPLIKEMVTLGIDIANKTLAGPSQGESLATHKQILREWNDRKEELEQGLARKIPEMKLEQKLRTANWKSIANALPKGATLVEFIRFHVFDFKAVVARGEDSWKPAHYLAFILTGGTSDTVHIVDLGETQLIDNMITEFIASITHEAKTPHTKIPSEPKQDTINLGSELRKIVFDPIKTAVEANNNSNNLLFAPDGELSRLPFEVLPLEDYVDQFLIDKYHISYLSTGRDLLRYDETNDEISSYAKIPDKPLVAANPDFDLSTDITSGEEEVIVASKPGSTSLESDHLIGVISKFSRLKHTKDEGEAIGALLDVKPLLDKAAIEATIKKCCSPLILHVATHGFFLPDQTHDPADDNLDTLELSRRETITDNILNRLSAKRLKNYPLLRSGLALAGVNTWIKGRTLPIEAEDGILTGEDASSLDLLRTELVVLSACDTGLGDVLTGEGVFGLRRSFVLAGAKTLVMSLWKVPDDQTRELMIDFYKLLLSGKPRAEALREAQLAMKEKYHNPYYWGAFICQGNSGPLSDEYQTSKPMYKGFNNCA